MPILGEHRLAMPVCHKLHRRICQLRRLVEHRLPPNVDRLKADATCWCAREQVHHLRSVVWHAVHETDCPPLILVREAAQLFGGLSPTARFVMDSHVARQPARRREVVSQPSGLIGRRPGPIRAHRVPSTPWTGLQ